MRPKLASQRQTRPDDTNLVHGESTSFQYEIVDAQLCSTVRKTFVEFFAKFLYHTTETDAASVSRYAKGDCPVNIA